MCPLPTFTGLPPHATFDDVKNKVNKLTQELTNIMLSLDSLNVVSLTADHIDAGTIDANVVTIRSDLTAGAYIQIDGNGMVINNGSVNTFTADINGAVTMTSATIRSLATGERVVIDSTGLHTYDAFGFERLTIGTAPVEGVKAVTFRDTTGAAQGVITYDTETVDGASRTGEYLTAHGCYLLFDNAGDIRTQDSSGKGFRTSSAGYPEMNNGFGWVTIASSGAATSTHVQPNHNHGITGGVQLATTADGSTVNGYVVWVESGGFSHSHTQT